METKIRRNLFTFTPSFARDLKVNTFRHQPLDHKAENNTCASLYRSVWEHSADGMRITDSEGIVIAVNKAYCDLVERSVRQIVGKPFTELYDETENPERLLASYKIRFVRRELKSGFERRMKLRSGNMLEAEVISSYIASTESETLMVAEFRDITERKRMQKELFESEAKYGGMFANSVQAMFVSSVDGKLLNANRAMMNLLGYDSLLDLADLDLARDIYVNPSDRTYLKEILEKRGYVSNVELLLKRKNGKIINVVEHARTLVNDSDEIVAFEGILEDITAKKAIEQKLHAYVNALEDSKRQLAELNSQKDRMVSVISHDLRSPFTSILGFCNILTNDKDGLTEEERIQFLGYIRESAESQLALVNKLLDWSRLESGQFRMDRKELDLAGVVDQGIHLLLGLGSAKQLSLKSLVPQKTFIRGDENLIQQVFNNLLSNAFKFTPSGGTISVALYGQKNDRWVLKVRDTGVGMSEEDLTKIFSVGEKFSRPGLQGERGAGFGLKVCQEIMQKHGGSITVESRQGEGSVFTLEFPNARPVGPTALVVDDEEGVRVLHARFIRKFLPDIKILFAWHRAEALEIAKTMRPKFILSDYQMPSMNGSKLLTALKADDRAKDIPVVIATGHNSGACSQDLIDRGAVEVLLKPVSEEQLGRAIHACVP